MRSDEERIRCPSSPTTAIILIPYPNPFRDSFRSSQRGFCLGPSLFRSRRQTYAPPYWFERRAAQAHHNLRRERTEESTQSAVSSGKERKWFERWRRKRGERLLELNIFLKIKHFITLQETYLASSSYLPQPSLSHHQYLPHR